MSTPANSTLRDAAAEGGSPGPGQRDGGPHEKRRPATAELQFLLIAIAFMLVMLLAGVPGKQETAGDGSPALQRGWAERHAAEVAAREAAAQAAGEALAPDSDGALDER